MDSQGQSWYPRDQSRCRLLHSTVSLPRGLVRPRLWLARTLRFASNTEGPHNYHTCLHPLLTYPVQKQAQSPSIKWHWATQKICPKQPLGSRGSRLTQLHHDLVTTTTIVLRPFVRDYLGEPVPEETLTHPPSWSSNLYQLLPSTTIHSILPVQITHLAIFLHNLSPCPLWSISWSGALHLIFHTFLHPTSVFFSQHKPISLQPVLL